ncbi:hypothetical protein [Pseudoalteromonas ostreae]|uniref:hypothetical protein n=1 Tax=Pseudoalteromonas ostreae TaxID=2774154 RepID=UPI001B3729D1|nr:hypothetical protein [Pseudoalteromonas ostreae]
MKTKLIILIFSVLTTLSFRAAASTDEQGVDALSQQTSREEQISRYPCCDPYSKRRCEIEPFESLTQNSVSNQQMIEAAKAVTMASPIYIGGARYTLNKSNFTPFYNTRVIENPCPWEQPTIISVLAGYEATFAVDGDFGQDLYFDISGRSNKSMRLALSCGSLNASDSGTKWVISKNQNTGGSCKAMKVKYSFSNSNSTAPSYIDLNVTISETLY